MPEKLPSKYIASAGDIETTYAYDGLGTMQDPFVVEFYEGDSENPMNWSSFRKSAIAAIVTLSVFAVTFTSSAYSESSIELMQDLKMGSEIFILGLSLFVLGFAIGPALWGPLVGLLGVVFVPETYGPVLLTKRANQLSKANGKVYLSILDIRQGKKRPSEVFQRALVRPWVLLFQEPIVLVASLYMAIIYGTVYMFMGAMPFVYNEGRGWSEGTGGLAFLGIAVGIIFGLIYGIWDNHTRYMKLFTSKSATAESRLPPAIVGAIALPVGMFAFAWTNSPSIHWSASIILTAPFGFGCVIVILPIVNYLIDSYTIYAASVLAAAAIFRSVVGAVFPLFTTQMYHNLGIHWASSVPAFLALACVPFPLVMYHHGAALRLKCKYAFEAAELMRKMQIQQVVASNQREETDPSG
ncbi:hypothetical protein PENSUB_12121 [Penicillium subrubescens]|uniref:Major facilitator superfamily (MFS) profile domain-containing protein n=1 Tax=Penicillium subrubescens TaxID=1316194 RepID=A0A1Q5T0Y5_9EURO|nr:hypothetical protein PENSUB_12121 [Penicillium subrubescens]